MDKLYSDKTDEQKKKENKFKHTEPNGSRLFFTQEETNEFKEHYQNALNENQTSFRYKNENFNTVYARYIISYMGQHGY